MLTRCSAARRASPIRSSSIRSCRKADPHPAAWHNSSPRACSKRSRPGFRFASNKAKQRAGPPLAPPHCPGTAMPTISAYIIAFNEAAKIKAAVESVLWADEIVVADSNSTDGTAEIAAGLGARVVQIPFQGFGDLRNRAIEACRCDWIFSLDADERCTAEVRDEILELLAGAPSFDVYRGARRNYMTGRW